MCNFFRANIFSIFFIRILVWWCICVCVCLCGTWTWMCMPVCTHVEARVGSQGMPSIIRYHCLGQAISLSWKITVPAGLANLWVLRDPSTFDITPPPQSLCRGPSFYVGAVDSNSCPCACQLGTLCHWDTSAVSGTLSLVVLALPLLS